MATSAMPSLGLLIPSLRFADGDDEERFRKDSEQDLLAPAMALSFGACLTTVGYMFFFYSEECWRPESHFSVPDSRSFTFTAWFFMVMLSGVLGFLFTMRFCCGLFACWHWEALFVASTTVYAVVVLVANRWHAPLLFDEDPTETWTVDPGHGAVTTPLLLDVGLTLVCTYFPVRWTIVWVLPACSVGVFTVLHATLPKATDGGELDLIFLFALAACALHGSYKNEKQRRERWTALQKVERAEADVEQLREEQGVHLGEIRELRQEIQVTDAEFMDVVIPLPCNRSLPGAVPAFGAAPHQDMAARGGHGRKKVKKQPRTDIRSTSFRSSCSSSSRSLEELSSTTASGMDGEWSLVHTPKGIASFLTKLAIKGDQVLDGDGCVTYLQTLDGTTYMDGRPLRLVGDELHRDGKRSRLTYVRASCRRTVSTSIDMRFTSSCSSCTSSNGTASHHTMKEKQLEDSEPAGEGTTDLALLVEGPGHVNEDASPSQQGIADG